MIQTLFQGIIESGKFYATNCKTSGSHLLKHITSKPLDSALVGGILVGIGLVSVISMSVVGKGVLKLNIRK